MRARKQSARHLTHEFRDAEKEPVQRPRDEIGFALSLKAAERLMIGRDIAEALREDADQNAEKAAHHLMPPAVRGRRLRELDELARPLGESDAEEGPERSAKRPRDALFHKAADGDARLGSSEGIRSLHRFEIIFDLLPAARMHRIGDPEAIGVELRVRAEAIPLFVRERADERLIELHARIKSRDMDKEERVQFIRRVGAAFGVSPRVLADGAFDVRMKLIERDALL